MQLTTEQETALLNFAKGTIIFRLRGGGTPDVTTSDKTLEQPAGCFVSLHRSHDHALRGCVGRMEAVQPLFQVVRDTSLSVLGDPRFTDRPVTLSELPQLEIDISVLSPLRPVDDPMDFEPLTDGIHLTIAGRSGVFLPQVARETGWTREQLLARLCTEKLGMPPSAWQLPEAKLQVFSTRILGPVPFFQQPSR
jgi:AmmeMemoRadiSam system protein A